jgi:N-acetylglutamate synthase-like GNAT family acetyltransferase
VVAVTPGGAVVGCGAIKEYSPSLAEVAAIAVAPEAHGRGLGRQIVTAVEALAVKRGIYDVFALTIQPAFFETVGYMRTERARYPEKIRRDCVGCVRRASCEETCVAKRLDSGELKVAA